MDHRQPVNVLPYSFFVSYTLSDIRNRGTAAQRKQCDKLIRSGPQYTLTPKKFPLTLSLGGNVNPTY